MLIYYTDFSDPIFLLSNDGSYKYFQSHDNIFSLIVNIASFFSDQYVILIYQRIKQSLPQSCHIIPRMVAIILTYGQLVLCEEDDSVTVPGGP